MPKDVNLVPNPSNPRWKTLSFPYLTVIILNEFLEKHPEQSYSGVGDIIVSILRDSQVFKEATAEYLIRHNLKSLSQDEIDTKLSEAIEYDKKFQDYLKKMELEKAFLKYLSQETKNF
jgi:hypothetical protein